MPEPAHRASPSALVAASGRRALLAALGGALLSAGLVRVPLLAVPSYEAGLIVGVVAALIGCWLGFEAARSRPLAPEIRWGLLRRTPGEAVFEECRAGLFAVAPVVLLPLFVLVTQAARTGCRWLPGLPPFLLSAVPAAFGGVALGILFGTLTRRRGVAVVLLVLFALCGAATTLAEGLAGPRHVVHDLLLGPISVGAYMGHDRGLTFPPSVQLHRLFALLAFTAALALAAWLRCRIDSPQVRPDEGEGEAREDDGGWSASRDEGPSRVRALLRHHRRGPRRLLGVTAVLALPFLLNPHAVGLLSGRALLEAEMPAVLETEHFRLHHAPGTSTEAHLERLSVEHEHAWLQVTSWLEISPDWKVDAWLHPSEDSLFRTTGARGYAFAAPWNREYHAVARDGEIRQLRHELVHVLASEFGGRAFGASWSTGLLEGLATALDEGHARAVEAHEAIAAAHAAGHVPAAERLTSLTGFAASDMDLSYRAAASFTGFLLREHGPAPFKAAYPRARLEAAYGVPPAELGKRWFAFLETEVPTGAAAAARARRRFDPQRHPAFHRSPCPRLGLDRSFTSPARRAHLLGLADRHDDAAAAWCEAWHASADPRHLEAAAAARLRAGRLEEALGLIERSLLAPGQDEDRAFGLHRRKALLLAALGRAAQARRSFAAAAEALGAPEGTTGSPSPPRDVALEQLALDAEGCSGPEGAAYALAALEDGRREGLASLRLDSAPAMRLALLASAGPAAASNRARRDELALSFATLSEQTPLLAARHLREQALAAERATDWPAAEAFHARILSLPGLPVLERLGAEDGLERAGLAPELGRAARAAQPEGPNCR